MEKTKITILCENRAGLPLGILGEHGFSALIEKGGEKILLDTGQGMALDANANTLGMDLSQINTIVISHGHYDHTGGLAFFKNTKQDMRIIAHPQIFEDKFILKEIDGKKQPISIGMKFSKQELESKMNATVLLQKQFTQISPGIFFSGEVPRVTDFEKNDPKLLVKSNDNFIQDTVIDDSSLLIETGSGPVILTGCAHSGIVNTMLHFQKKAKVDKFHAVIGGTHLGFLDSPAQLEKTIQAFKDFHLDLIAVSHCTGDIPAAVCYHEFREKFAFANAGWSKQF
ncbi:MAG: MBL fold metallo-hydrolase [Desulfobacteraceae bacterium]|nr:MBL fold metallo-hydrolase [Desulfobacteraceae bacterium]